MDLLTILWLIAVIVAIVTGFVLGALFDRLLGFFKTRHQRALDRIERQRLDNLDHYLRTKARIDSATHLAGQRIQEHLANQQRSSASQSAQVPPASETITGNWTSQ